MRKESRDWRRCFQALALPPLLWLAVLGTPNVAHPSAFSAQQDGQWMFPLGMFEVPIDSFPEVAAAGFNTVANFWANADSDKRFLSAAADHGLLGIVGIDSNQARGSRSSVKKFVQSYVSNLGIAPKPVAYLLPDEALSTQGITVGKLMDIRNTVKQIDSSALTVYQDWTKESAVSAKSTYDIFAWDYYPIGSNGKSIENWRTDLLGIAAAVGPKPFWLTLQAYVDPPLWLEPSRDELRIMAYTAIANGARGVLAYHYCGTSCRSHGSDVWNYPQLWHNLKELTAELRSVSSILTLPDSTNVTVAPNVTGIDVKVKQGSDKYYLVAANWKSAKYQPDGHYAGQAFPNVSFTVAGVNSGTVKTITPAGSTSPSPVADGRFLDSFGAYAAKIYELTP